MKRLTIASCLLWAVVLLSSCGGLDLFDYGLTFTEPNDVAKLEAILEKNIDAEDKITHIQFKKGTQDQRNFSFDKGTIEVYYLDPENAKQEKVYLIDIKKEEAYVNEWAENHSRTLYSKNVKSCADVKASSLGCGRIAEFLNAAIEVMAAENIKANGLGLYTIYPNSDPAKVRHEFSVEHITGGGDRVTNYTEYSFKVDLKDGELIYK